MLNNEGPYSEESGKALFKQILEAVAYFHSMRITHRDLKPSNILLGGTRKNPIPKISDFGTARISDQMSTLCGTPDYAAPEVLLGNHFTERKYDNKVDMWSLGIILYMMFVFLFNLAPQNRFYHCCFCWCFTQIISKVPIYH